MRTSDLKDCVRQHTLVLGFIHFLMQSVGKFLIFDQIRQVSKQNSLQLAMWSVLTKLTSSTNVCTYISSYLRMYPFYFLVQYTRTYVRTYVLDTFCILLHVLLVSYKFVYVVHTDICTYVRVICDEICKYVYLTH